jgi:hypothetical protein
VYHVPCTMYDAPADLTRISRGSHADLTRISRGSHADLTRHFPRIHDATFYTPADSSGAFEATHFESRHVAAMNPRENVTKPQVEAIQLTRGSVTKINQY